MSTNASSSNVEDVRRVTLAGCLLNLVLFIFKLWAGTVGGSRAVVADAFHTLSDLSTDLAIVFGVKVWMSPPDKCHPYGHRKIESLVTLFVGAMLAGVGVWLAADGVNGLRDSSGHSPRLIALTGALVSILVKELMFRWTAAVGRNLKSQAVTANAWHHRSDAFSSVPTAIAVGTACFLPQYAFVDHVGELIVAAVIVRVSFKIMHGASVELSDGTATQEGQEAIERIALSVDGVKGVHAVRSRRSGPGFYADLHVLVDGNASVREGHDISSSVKRKLIESGPDIVDAVIHIEPDNSARRIQNPL